MKYYIPTSSLNLDNILQAECISPESFYAQRLSGYRSWEQLEQFRPFRQIVLFRSPISFTIKDPNRYNYPILIEFDGTNQDYDFIPIEDGIYLCNHTIQITPSNCRIFFFSESAYNLTVINTKSNKTIKFFEKYLIYPNVPFHHFHELKIPTNMLAMELGKNQEIFTDKAKGALYAWMLGLKSSVNKELAIKINRTQSIYNILTSLSKNPDSFSRFRPNLDTLLEQFKSVDEIEKINKHTYYINLENKADPRFRFLIPCFIDFLKKLGCWDSVNAKLCSKWNCSLLPNINELTSSQDFLALRTEVENRTKKSLASYQSKIDFTDLSKINISKFSITIQNAPLISITLKCIIDNKWTCEYLMANRLEAYKILMSNVVAYLKEKKGEESWKNSNERTYINNLFAFLYDPSRSFNLSFFNKELEAISAFLIKGNSYIDMISYLKINEIENYTLPLVLWGALCGYMDMNRDYLDGILSESIYSKVYRMLFGVDCSILSAEDNTTDSTTQLNEISPKDTFNDNGYMFILQILKFKNPEKFIKRILELSTKDQLSIKQSLDLTLSTKEYKKAKTQSNNARVAYELVENRENLEFLKEKMHELKLSKKAQVQVLEYFGYQVINKTTKNKKIRSSKNKHESPSLFGDIVDETKNDTSIEISRSSKEEIDFEQIIIEIPLSSEIFIYDSNAISFIKTLSYIKPYLSDIANDVMYIQKEYQDGGQYAKGGKKESDPSNNQVIKHLGNLIKKVHKEHPIPEAIVNKLTQDLFDRYNVR